jgi:hypothetical protein
MRVASGVELARFQSRICPFSSPEANSTPVAIQINYRYFVDYSERNETGLAKAGKISRNRLPTQTQCVFSDFPRRNRVHH